MVKSTISVSHRLSQDEAIRRIKTLLGKAKEQHGDKISNLREDWSYNVGKYSFTVMGYSLSGVLTVNYSSVELVGEYPDAAAHFKGTVESMLKAQAEKLLA